MIYTELDEYMQSTDTYLLYGAGIIGYNVSTAIKELYHIEPKAVIISDLSSDSNRLADIDICTPDQIEPRDWKLAVIVATPEIYHHEISLVLKKYTHDQVFYFDTHMEYCLMSRYFEKIGSFMLLENLPSIEKREIEEIDKVLTVYMARSHKDKMLTKTYTLPDWIRQIQAGAMCTDKRFGIITDEIGENISIKNPNYCELTVTYWVWKNISKRYKGICHYRRVLQLDPYDIERIIKNDVDVILPLPFVCYPNAAAQYGRYVSKYDRECLARALKDTYPDYEKELEKMDRQSYFYNYNMLIAKNEVFDDYCEWLFNVLARVEKYCETRNIRREDRYAGYLGEILTSLYFSTNAKKYKIVHAEKIWMV